VGFHYQCDDFKILSIDYKKAASWFEKILKRENQSQDLAIKNTKELNLFGTNKFKINFKKCPRDSLKGSLVCAKIIC
jgi:hypothetical protein